MRVKFGNRIRLCATITHSDDSKLLIITTISNEVYTADMLTIKNAENYFDKLLKSGYCDLSEYEYSN